MDRAPGYSISGLMSFREINKTKDIILFGKESPFSNSCSVVMDMGNWIPGSPLI